MNTTSYEDGLRFLLANYRIPDPDTSQDWPDTRPNYKARSFLATYSTGKRKAGAFTPDLPLATAAQLSAAFPYISSAARVPMSIDNQVNAAHFVDGGYYDNDGTGSVLEFLRYALARTPSVGKDVCEAWSKEEETKASSRKLRILLIEIRNSGDDLGGEFDQWPNHTSANDARQSADPVIRSTWGSMAGRPRKRNRQKPRRPGAIGTRPGRQA